MRLSFISFDEFSMRKYLIVCQKKKSPFSIFTSLKHFHDILLKKQKQLLHLQRLRQKLHLEKQIVTVYKLGYRLEVGL